MAKAQAAAKKGKAGRPQLDLFGEGAPRGGRGSAAAEKAPPAAGKPKDAGAELAAEEPPPATPEPRAAQRVTAESLATKQREISVSEFFVKNRHLLGFDNPSKALLTTIKEAVDNSLDACEEAGILPELTIEVHDLALEAGSRTRAHQGRRPLLVVVQDNGPGIVKPQVPKIFGKLLYGSKFHRLKQARGQQGIGISAAAMYGQLTTGKPIRVTSRVGKRKDAHVFDIQIDTRKNEPVVTHDETLEDWHQEHGTRVELEIVANWQQGQRFVNRYVEHTALANPHATIHYTRPVGAAQRASADRPGNETLVFPRATDELPKEAIEIKPHPHGVELGALMLMAAGVEEPRRARLPADDLQPRLGPGRRRDPGQGALGQEGGAAARPRREPGHGRGAPQGDRRDPAHEPADELPEPDRRRAHAEGARQLPERDRERGRERRRERPARPRLGRQEAGEEGREGRRRRARRSRPRRSPDAPPEEGVEKIKGHNYFIATVTRPPKVYRGNPFQVEVGLAYGGSWPADKTIELFRFANRVPLLFQRGACGITEAIVRTDWRNYQLSQPKGSLPVGPMALLVHIASVWVPFTSESKEAVAHYPDIIKEIQLAAQECGRKLATFIRKRKAADYQAQRRSIFELYIEEVAAAIGKITGRKPGPIKREFLKVAHKVTAAEMKEEEEARELEARQARPKAKARSEAEEE